MKLLTKEIRKKLPGLLAQDDKGDEAIAYVKFFTPWGKCSWYAIEFDGADTFFGVVAGDYDYLEYGTFSLSALMAIKGVCGLKVERDKLFYPMPVSKIREILELNP